MLDPDPENPHLRAQTQDTRLPGLKPPDFKTPGSRLKTSRLKPPRPASRASVVNNTPTKNPFYPAPRYIRGP